MSISSVLHAARRSTEPALHHLRCANVVFATAKCRPDPCQEVVQVCGEETHELSESGIRTVHDEGHEEHSEGQVFAFEGNDEEGYGSGGVILGERVGVGEGQRREEGVLV